MSSRLEDWPEGLRRVKPREETCAHLQEQSSPRGSRAEGWEGRISPARAHGVVKPLPGGVTGAAALGGGAARHPRAVCEP